MSATRPGPDMAIWMLEAAIVSQHVAPQMKRRPWARGVMVISSGHLPLERDSACSSSTDDMLAIARLLNGGIQLVVTGESPFTPATTQAM